ncbi:helicase (Partial), partial [Seminavis robusta]|eukprot:Sro1611_g285880.1 helicase (261) ;mRNA; r:10-928
MTKTRKASAAKASALVTLDVDEDANMSQSDKFQKRWDIMFAKLESYSKKFGDCLVPVRWKQDPSLGKWVSRQRDGHNAKFLTEERKARLNAIGFVWRCKDYNNLYPQSKGEKAQFKRPQVVPVVATTTTKTRNTRACAVKKDGARTATAAVAKNRPTKKKIPVAKKRTVTKAPKPTTRAAKVCPIRPAPDNSKNAKKKAPTKASTRSGPQQTFPNNNYQRVVPADQGEWVHQYEKLVHYKSRHGHTRFPRPYTADPLLGAW